MVITCPASVCREKNISKGGGGEKDICKEELNPRLCSRWPSLVTLHFCMYFQFYKEKLPPVVDIYKWLHFSISDGFNLEIGAAIATKFDDFWFPNHWYYEITFRASQTPFYPLLWIYFENTHSDDVVCVRALCAHICAQSPNCSVCSIQNHGKLTRNWMDIGIGQDGRRSIATFLTLIYYIWKTLHAFQMF